MYHPLALCRATAPSLILQRVRHLGPTARVPYRRSLITRLKNELSFVRIAERCDLTVMWQLVLCSSSHTLSLKRYDGASYHPHLRRPWCGRTRELCADVSLSMLHTRWVSTSVQERDYEPLIKSPLVLSNEVSEIFYVFPCSPTPVPEEKIWAYSSEALKSNVMTECRTLTYWHSQEFPVWTAQGHFWAEIMVGRSLLRAKLLNGRTHWGYPLYNTAGRLCQGKALRWLMFWWMNLGWWEQGREGFLWQNGLTG